MKEELSKFDFLILLGKQGNFKMQEVLKVAPIKLLRFC